MLRFAVLLAGLATLAVVIAAAVHRAAPRIEHDIAARASVALVSAGIDWARVAMDGRTLTLSGVAPTPAARDEAVATVRRVPGVKAVNVSVGRAPAGPGPDDIASLAIVRKPGQVLIEGVVNDVDAAERLAAEARALFPDSQLVENVRISGRSGIARADSAIGLLPALTQLDTGRIVLADGDARLEGTAASPSGRVRATETFRAAVPADTTADVVVEVPVPVQSASTCQVALDRILADNVRFAPNESAISPASHDLLDQVVRVILACPGLDIAVAAHTDAGGEEASNLALTQARADEILAYLVRGGVPASRLVARGYGSSRPIADNDSRTGRRANRRIEITVQNPST